MQAPLHREPRRRIALAQQLRAPFLRQRVEPRRQIRHVLRRQRLLHRRLADHAGIGQPHAIGREHPGEGMHEDRLHPQLVRHQAGMLPARPAEALERVARGIVPLLDAHLPDRMRHVGHRDAQEALGHGARVHLRLAGRRRDLSGQRSELLPHHPGIQRLAAIRPEDRREVLRLHLAGHDIRIGDGERSAAPVAGRPRHRPRAFRPDAEARAVEAQPRAAARRHRVDRHHRRAHPHARHLGFEGALELPRIERHIRAGAAHVEADDAVEARHGGGARRADDAARRAGQDRVLALEASRIGQPAGGAHEGEPRAVLLRPPFRVQLPRHLRDIAAQDRREIGIHHRRVGARHEARQRRGPVRQRDLGEAFLARQDADALLVRRIGPGMQQRHRHGGDAVRLRRPQRRARRILVQGLDLPPLGVEPAADLGHALMQQRGQAHIQVEEARPRLVADARQVGEAPVQDQQHPLALALQQRIGGDRGAHLHRLDRPGRQRLARRQPEDRPDARHRRVPIGPGILGQQLARAQPPFRVARHDVGEGPAAIHPELPARHRPIPILRPPGPEAPGRLAAHDAQRPAARQPAPAPGKGRKRQRMPRVCLPRKLRSTA